MERSNVIGKRGGEIRPIHHGEGAKKQRQNRVELSAVFSNVSGRFEQSRAQGCAHIWGLTHARVHAPAPLPDPRPQMYKSLNWCNEGSQFCNAIINSKTPEFVIFPY